MTLSYHTELFTNFLALVFLHLTVYTLSSLTLFVACSACLYKNTTTFSFSSFLQENTLALAALTAIASMAGVPPFLGFWTKTLLLVNISRYGTTWLIIVCWLIATLALFFYLNALRYVVSFEQAKPLQLDNLKMQGTRGLLLFNTLLLLSGFVFLGDLILFATLLFI